MLRLMPEQLRALDRSTLEAMIARVRQALASTFPEVDEASGAGEPIRLKNDLSQSVDGLIEKGLELGFQSASELAAFIALGAALRQAAISPTPAWLRGWLNRPDTPGATRLAMIESILADRARQDPAWQQVAGQVAAARKATLA